MKARFFWVTGGALLLILALVWLHNRSQAPKAPGGQSKTETRSFRMGFTSSPHDVSEEGFRQTFQFLKQNSDLLAHYFSEGIPWHEAARHRPYHRKIDDMINFLAISGEENQKIFLYMTPLNVEVNNVAKYWGLESRSKWVPKTLDDPGVLPAYLNFCKDLIARFKPDYMAYGIDVNALAASSPKNWPKFVELGRSIYTALKSENPNLPVFVSLSARHFWQDPVRQTTIIQQILPFSDYVAISAYPHLMRKVPAELPRDFFSRLQKLAPAKPFAIAETGYPAQGGTIEDRFVRGNPSLQNRYLEFALEESQKLNAQFFIWFVHRDYDPVVRKVLQAEFSDSNVALFKIRKDTGLVGHKGQTRRALQTWSRWFHLPLR